MHVAQETLGLRRQGLSPCLSLLMSAFALPIPPAGFTPHLHRPTERSPTIQTLPSARLITNPTIEQLRPVAILAPAWFAQPLEFRVASREPRRLQTRSSG